MNDWDSVERQLAAMSADFVIARSEHPITDEQLDAASSRLGVSLPEELRTILRRTDALYVDAREEVWPVFGGGPAWIFFRGLILFGVSDQVPAELRIEAAKREVELAGSPDFLPCARVIADPCMYGYNSNGHLSLWSPDGTEEPVDGTLLDVIVRELENLQKSAVRIRAYPPR